METFIVDVGGGMTSPYVVQEMKRLGVHVDIRAPRQHARFVERRGAALRRAARARRDAVDIHRPPSTSG
eukprot:6554388-Pyramimonas_sp.AAC.1